MRSTSRQSAARLREHLDEVLGTASGSSGSGSSGSGSSGGRRADEEGSGADGGSRRLGGGDDAPQTSPAGGTDVEGSVRVDAASADDSPSDDASSGGGSTRQGATRRRRTRPAGEGPVGLTVDGEPVDADGSSTGGSGGGDASSGGGEGSDGAALAEQLWAVVDVLDGSASLRRSLSDPGTDPDGRKALVRRLFGERLDGRAVDVVEHAAGLRWSEPRDLADALEEAGSTAVLADAQGEDRLSDVEDELFRFSRLVARQSDLRTALSRVTPGPRREALVRGLLADRATSATTALVSRVARAPRGQAVDTALEDLVDLAASRRDQLVASVRVPLALDEDQRERLRGALGRMYGRDVALQVDVDPTVLGGGVVRVGDEVLDGSVSHRLEVAAQRVAPGRRRSG